MDTIELLAGAGGLALDLPHAGFAPITAIMSDTFRHAGDVVGTVRPKVVSPRKICKSQEVKS